MYALTLLAVAVSAAVVQVVPPPLPTNGAFVGTGQLTVLRGKSTVGCLSNTMQFTTDTSQCGTYTGTPHENCDPNFGCGGIYYTLATSAGPCAPIFRNGSQYEEGGNGVLVCGSAAVGSDKTVFSVTDGVNDQIGLTLLEDSNGSASFNTIRGARASKQPQDLQDDLRVGPQDGPSYALTWKAT